MGSQRAGHNLATEQQQQRIVKCGYILSQDYSFFKKYGRVESFDTYFQIIFTGTKNRIPQFLKTKIHMKTHCRNGVMQEDTSLPSESYNIERRVSRFSQI